MSQIGYSNQPNVKQARWWTRARRDRASRTTPLMAWLLLTCTGGLVAEAKPPHIIVYLSDDHSQFDAGLYGAADIPTPHFEELAASGMVFTHAFVASPSCAPSRAAMLTGLMPSRNGAEANHTYPPDGVHYLVAELQQLGYEVAAFGKVAHSRDRGARLAGFDRISGGASYAALRHSVSDYLAQRSSEQPLCLMVGISNPHVPWPEQTSFDPDGVELPPTHLDTPATRAHRASYYQEIKEVDQLLGELRELATQHLGSDVLFMHTSDHGSQWPFGKWTLYDYGTRVPLLAAWPGVIPEGSQSDAMISLVDLLPTLIDLAGGQAPEGIDGRSFARVARGDSDEHRERIFTTHSGDGRMNIYPIRSVRTRDWKLIHNLHPEFAFTNHSDLHRKPGAGAYWTEWAERARTDPRAQQVLDRYYRRPEWELYHVRSDRWERRNLADEPAYQATLIGLQQELADWMASQGDRATVLNQPRPLDQPATWHPDVNQEAVDN